MRFDDGIEMDFPCEAVEEQLTSYELYRPVFRVELGKVLLLQDPKAYEGSFYKFYGANAGGNGWSEEKEKYCGKTGLVTVVYNDRTVTVLFEDGVKLDFPFESVQ